ncbi:MAG TPA: SDR family NAD(P)-dependent oxidoreductase [Candidatus Dormibacteraeota bacterium]|jgi:NAD(P)-dependent dehydrogenase (short-subunit alcohol dehydrogenase family)|nr:SDR family NAD(P)-dependent oxidoreductase [Candidatus Dormibacteraeota bacterium]
MNTAGGPSVVVTGASTGIGEATALHLDRCGWRVFAGVRRSADAQRLQAAASPRLTALTLDVSDGASIAAACAAVDEQLRGSGLGGLVNNAGISGGDPLEFTPLDSLRTMLEVNLVGLVATTQAFLPLLRRNQGRIVCIGSIGGRTPVPFTAAYAASKAAVAAVCDCLRLELRPWRIRVALVEPGSVATPIWEKGLSEFDEKAAAYPADAIELYGAAMTPMRKATERAARSGIAPARVARVVEHALTSSRPRTRYLVGRDARMQAVARRLPDRARDRLIGRVIGLP